ncbi:hypothetical protein D3H55_15045 [Bacillus salacetis]|uniref:DUF4065 domain-containing protein n=1 Tax=Bacillus salacetis TaxID=2315464 RepID=A0A3A1QUT2_9BACI|nr:hypothetical protein [Bacillus salacetis]RIW31608.1 hypothetical protein D3H55_15045 [Bacillus salacetis]
MSNENTKIISYIIKKYGPIKGKKAFQKIFYFLTENGIPTGLTYSLYHYGPYSSKLDTLTEQFELNGAIKLIQKGIGYELIQGDKVDDILSENKDEKTKDIDFILDNLPLDNPLQLELLSTTHYAAKVQKEIYDETDIEEVVKEVKRIKKSKFTEDNIKWSYEYLQNLKWI